MWHSDEENEKDDSVEDFKTIKKELDRQLREDDIQYFVIELKINMKEYIQQERIPFLEKFDPEVWAKFVSMCLK